MGEIAGNETDTDGLWYAELWYPKGGYDEPAPEDGQDNTVEYGADESDQGERRHED